MNLKSKNRIDITSYLLIKGATNREKIACFFNKIAFFDENLREMPLKFPLEVLGDKIGDFCSPVEKSHDQLRESTLFTEKGCVFE